MDSGERHPITILTAQMRIDGYVKLPSEARLSDWLDESNQFFEVMDAVVYERAADSPTVGVSAMLMNRAHVRLVIDLREPPRDRTYVGSRVRVRLLLRLTDGLTVDGYVSLPTGASWQGAFRASDRRLQPVTDATVWRSGALVREGCTVLVDRASILFVSQSMPS